MELLVKERDLKKFEEKKNLLNFEIWFNLERQACRRYQIQT